MNKIKLFLVEDHSIVRKGLKLILDYHEDFEICGEAECISEALENISKAKPDIVLLDIKLPDGDGVTACQEIKKRCSQCRVLILTAFTEKHMVLEAVKAGADGYLLKSAESDILFDSIIKVYQGLSVLDPKITKDVLKEVKSIGENGDDNLTSKEQLILELISSGKTNKEIGHHLNLTEKTVRNYISKIFKRINVANRTEAARYWMRKSVFK
ncbi:response regulator transcription factor [Proteinivorax hydrogeniformans]|uniref:Stage 0 sporulation protein A homolog n=1 Tax=Proteinivorax hydrogeniformans TaxID=1826727 RepID=A0AAU8HVR3_9FIRM